MSISPFTRCLCLVLFQLLQKYTEGTCSVIQQGHKAWVGHAGIVLGQLSDRGWFRASVHTEVTLYLSVKQWHRPADRGLGRSTQETVRWEVLDCRAVSYQQVTPTLRLETSLNKTMRRAEQLAAVAMKRRQLDNNSLRTFFPLLLHHLSVLLHRSSVIKLTHSALFTTNSFFTFKQTLVKCARVFLPLRFNHKTLLASSVSVRTSHYKDQFPQSSTGCRLISHS